MQISKPSKAFVAFDLAGSLGLDADGAGHRDGASTRQSTELEAFRRARSSGSEATTAIETAVARAVLHVAWDEIVPRLSAEARADMNHRAAQAATTDGGAQMRAAQRRLGRDRDQGLDRNRSAA